MPSISLPTAAIVGAGVSGAASLIGASKSASAAKSAAKTQADAATLAANNQMEMFNKTQANLSPYMAAGQSGLSEAENLLGLGQQGQNGIEAALEATPGYQFTKQQGLESVQNSYAARGLGSSGAALKGAANYATGLANTTYEERLGNYLGLAGAGQNAAAGLGFLGQQATTTANQFATSGAAATAAGTVGATNALTAGLTGTAGSINNALLLSSLSGTGMFGGGAGGSNNAFDPEYMSVTPDVYGNF